MGQRVNQSVFGVWVNSWLCVTQKAYYTLGHTL